MPAESPTQVVDEKDQPIDVQRRDYIQKNGLWHRIVGVWIVDEDGNMLVQKRQSGRGLDDEKLDSSASGHVDPGEDYAETAVREAREELGINFEKDQLRQIAYFQTQNTNGDKILNRFTKVFIAELDRKSMERMHVDEVELGGVEWLSVDDVTDLVTNHPEQTVPGFVIAWYVSNRLPVPLDVINDNNVVIDPVKAS